MHVVEKWILESDMKTWRNRIWNELLLSWWFRLLLSRPGVFFFLFLGGGGIHNTSFSSHKWSRIKAETIQSDRMLKNVRLWGAKLDIVFFRQRSCRILISHTADCNGPKLRKTLMFLGQAGTFLSFQARRSSATRSSTSDLTATGNGTPCLRLWSLCWPSVTMVTLCLSYLAHLVLCSLPNSTNISHMTSLLLALHN